MLGVMIEREECISCGNCWNICPQVFEQNADDGFSQIATDWQVSGEITEGCIDDELEDYVRQAADGCPVSAIVIE